MPKVFFQYSLKASAIAGVGMLAACANQTPNTGNQTRLIPAHPTVEVAPQPQPLNMLPQPPQDLRPIPTARRNARVNPIDANTRAMRASTAYPTPSGYTNAVMVYDYEFGQVYKVYGAPLHVTMLALQPGERLISKAAGDTVRWLLGDTVSGTGAQRRVLVMLKPMKPGLQTNIILTTDRRVYLLDATSGEGNAYQNAIAWNYADDPQALAQAASNQANDVGTDINVANLNYGYKIKPKTSPKPVWTPKEAFDDGQKTYIEFPENLGSMEAPPFFIRGKTGHDELVNYRVKGRFYIVDRVFQEGELRIGDYKHQEVVRIQATTPNVIGE